MPARKPSARRPASARPPAPSEIEQRFAAAMAGHRGPLAIAVSGGSDSLALMHLAAGFARARKMPTPVVLTVNHGLREGSDRDARKTARWARAAGLTAHILSWQGKKPKSGLEAAAREARYRLMGDWLVKKRIATLLVGHTQDDQAETFLLRLARGSGLDGLSAMEPQAPWPLDAFVQLSLARPLLTFSRQELRDYLSERGQDWLDDPMNEDMAFDRVKMRKAREALAGAGLSAARIAAAAAHLARARRSLEIVTGAVLARVARPLRESDGVLLESAALVAAPREVGLRALATVLMAVGGQAYRPRFDSLERLFDRIAGGSLNGGATLHGCHLAPAPRIFAPHDLLVRAEKTRKTASSGTTRK